MPDVCPALLAAHVTLLMIRALLMIAPQISPSSMICVPSVHFALDTFEKCLCPGIRVCVIVCPRLCVCVFVWRFVCLCVFMLCNVCVLGVRFVLVCACFLYVRVCL